MNITEHKKPNRPERVIQFGVGVFLRGFFDWMLQKANDSGKYCGNAVIVQPIETGKCDILSEQNCNYTHIMRGVEGVEETLIDSVSRCVNPYTDYESYLELARQTDFRFIVSNTTEAGIAYHAGDSIADKPPFSFPAKVCALLYERFKAKLPGFVFLPCELIENNGDTLKSIILRYANEWGLDSRFTSWIDRENTFCNTLVDRIVTGYPKDEDELLSRGDKMINTSEYYHLWVIEGGKEISDELPFDKIGLNVVWTDDIEQYRTRKVRILNGAHTSMVPYAMLKGYTTVRECVESDEIGGFIRECVYNEIIPTLDMPREELTAYADSVIDRFKNPYIRHYLSSIALNTVDKFRVRVMPSIIEYKRRIGRYPETLMKAFDAFCDFYKTDMVNDSQENIEYMRNHTKEEIFEWLSK